MPRVRSRIVITALAILGLLVVLLLLPRPVDAQCGTQASSCKNCHEVQAQDPVNTEGDWHVDHAFGDFCEFCHAGNVTATDKDAAHTGLIYPLDDLAGSCSSCHPTDYAELGQKYADTLGVEVGSGSTAPDTGADTGSNTPSDGATPVPASNTSDTSTGSSGGQVIDLNRRYESQTAQTKPLIALNTGNLILSLMLVGLVGTFGGLIWKFEGLGAKWAALRGRASQALPSRVPPVTTAALTSEAMAELIPVLEKTSPATLASLSRLLESDPEQGGQMIEALARLDPRLVEAVRRLDQKDLELLMALVRDLKERA